MKNIIKEIAIMLLLLAAIVLGLGVLFYDYIPSSKVVPTILENKTPENITEELSETITNNSEEVLITYEVDSKDLKVYEKTKDYNAGNPNPFSYYTTGTVNNTNKDNTTSTKPIPQTGETLTIAGIVIATISVAII